MQPCRCASIPFKFEPHKERAADETMISAYVSDASETTEKRVAAIMRRLAVHEAGHILAAAAFGKQIDHATIGRAQPHVCYHMTTGEKTVDAQSIIDAAGLAAEGNIPGWDIFGPAVRRAREGVNGFCDVCRIANLAVAAVPERSNFEIINLIFDTFDAAAVLFASPEWSAALDALASELERETLLTGPAIMEIIKGYDLAEPLSDIQPIWTQTHET